MRRAGLSPAAETYLPRVLLLIERKYDFCKIRTPKTLSTSDVKRGQILEAKAEAEDKPLRTRTRTRKIFEDKDEAEDNFSRPRASSRPEKVVLNR